MTLRDEYKDLKTELMIRLTDATVMCNLDFPFDFKISKEDEDRYFIRGTKTRLALKKAMIIMDNSYKKVRLFPSEDIAEIFTETRDDILKDFKETVIKAFISEEWRFRNDDIESFTAYIDSLIAKFRELSLLYLEKLKALTVEDIQKEIGAKYNLEKLKNSAPFNRNKPEEGIF